MGANDATLQDREPVLTVFQASPLAYDDYDGKEVAIQSLDLEAESNALTEALRNSKIRVQFEIATSNNLGKILSQGNRLLHFSCHGHPEYLMIENGFGGGQTLSVDDLKEWIKIGGNKLFFVFLSACSSRNAGEALLDAGVQHIVYCGRRVSDAAAIIFARDFYRALANGKKLREAYDLAIHAVIHAPETGPTVSERMKKAKNFSLLPEGADHNVHLSFDTQSLSSRKAPSSPFMPPVPPQNFVGREVDMYCALKALFSKRSRLVRITGSSGIGKKSLARALANYINRRNIWGELLWFPSSRQGKGGDLVSHWLKLFELISNEQTLSSFQTSSEYQKVCEAIFVEFYEKKALIFVDTVGMRLRSPQKLCIFLDGLFDSTKNVKVIIVHKERYKIKSHESVDFPVSQREISLKALDFETAINLLKSCTRETSHDHLLDMILKERAGTVNDVLEEGVPAKIIKFAQTMTEENYSTNNDDKMVDYIEADDGPKFAPRPPLRSQAEVQNRFGPLLRKEGTVSKKSVTSFARKGVKGEKIVTCIGGVHETENTVENDNSWVLCGKAAGEYYVLLDKDFHESYDETTARPIREEATQMFRTLRQKGFLEYDSKRLVWARKVDEHDMDWFRHGRKQSKLSGPEVYFMASWGEPDRTEQGDFLVMQYPPGNPEVYRIECGVFEASYKAYSPDGDDGFEDFNALMVCTWYTQKPVRSLLPA